MGTFWQDVQYGFRMLLKRPGFTLVALVALALGIGANTAIFSVVNAVLLRPLPFDKPERLVMIWGSAPQLGFDVLPPTASESVDWREQSHVFEQVAAFKSWAWNMSGTNGPEQVWGARVNASLFPALGVKPLLGRTFLPEEDRAGGAKVVVMGHGLWQRSFGSDPAIIGKTVTLNNLSYTVVGVMPPGFKFPGGENMLSGLQFSPKTELWEPMAFTDEELSNRGTHNLAVVARLKPDATLWQARTEMTTIAAHLAEQYPKFNKGIGVKLVPLHEQVVGDVRPALLILLGTVGFVLLIACANVANLLLARASSRQKEIAIRTALGASRLRVVRQLLTESVLLSLMGGAAGLLLALWGIDALGALIPENIPRANEIGVDSRMLGFTLLISLLTGLIFGLAPSLQASKTDINEALKDGTRGASTGSGRNRFRGMLVVSEIALALVLLVGAGLLIRSFMRLQQVDPGFEPKSVVAMEIVLPFIAPSNYKEPEQQAAFFRQTLERAATLPGVQAATVVSSLPLSGAFESTDVIIEGQPEPPNGDWPPANYTMVSADYFRVMSIPLMKGRALTERDTKESPGVVVINETMARHYWPGEDAIGKRLTMGFEKTPREVVGVVGDVRQNSLDVETPLAVYLPYQQFPYPGMTLVVRTVSDPASMAAAVRREVQAIDASLPVSNVRSMDEVVATSVSQRRFNMTLLGIFASVALLLSAVGIYGVMSYSVTQRTHEIGIRIALGAGSRDILRLVVGQGMLLTLIGVALGLAASLVLTRLMASLIYGVSATDPLTFAGVSLALALVALLACLIPARRATKVDPMEALRYE
ncbi:MAG TPA: ABC transporter permease [Pyrinomonadaceae bacterium]|jgi:putative ABC transport system permease protein